MPYFTTKDSNSPGETGISLNIIQFLLDWSKRQLIWSGNI